MPVSSEVAQAPSRYFDIEHDGAIINAGGFWCGACLFGKPGSNTRSPDPRYCQDCYGLLLKEAEILPQGKRPAWIPRATRATVHYENQHENLYQAPSPIKEEKTKMSTLNSPSLTVNSFRPRGRPKTYKKRPLPDDKIKQLHKEGMGAKAIATQLKKEQGVDVSYKTIQRVLAGRRN